MIQIYCHIFKRRDRIAERIFQADCDSCLAAGLRDTGFVDTQRHQRCRAEIEDRAIGNAGKTVAQRVIDRGAFNMNKISRAGFQVGAWIDDELVILHSERTFTVSNIKALHRTVGVRVSSITDRDITSTQLDVLREIERQVGSQVRDQAIIEGCGTRRIKCRPGVVQRVAVVVGSGRSRVYEGVTTGICNILTTRK